jgi:hypothetical protein
MVVAVAAGFYFLRPSRVEIIPIEPTASTAYRFTFDIPNMTALAPMRRFPFGIRSSAYVQDTYLYVFADGQRISPRGAEVYSNAKATDRRLDLQVEKPLAGMTNWRFEVHRRITEFYYLPGATVSLGPREEIWRSEVFTNEFRPPDVQSLTDPNPFE